MCNWSISHGGGLTDGQASSLPGSPLVVRLCAAGRAAHARAAHADACGPQYRARFASRGVPLVAVPITYEQPAIAGRVREWRAGCILSVRGIYSALVFGAPSRHVLRAEEDFGSLRVR